MVHPDDDVEIEMYKINLYYKFIYPYTQIYYTLIPHTPTLQKTHILTFKGK